MPTHIVQDTIKSSPPENKTMKRATLYGILTTTAFYLSVGCAGYAAFGNNAPGNLLTGFGFYKPFWLVDFANACIVVHLVGAYQVLPNHYYVDLQVPKLTLNLDSANPSFLFLWQLHQLCLSVWITIWNYMHVKEHWTYVFMRLECVIKIYKPF